VGNLAGSDIYIINNYLRYQIFVRLICGANPLRCAEISHNEIVRSPVNVLLLILDLGLIYILIFNLIFPAGLICGEPADPLRYAELFSE